MTAKQIIADHFRAMQKKSAKARKGTKIASDAARAASLARWKKNKTQK